MLPNNASNLDINESQIAVGSLVGFRSNRRLTDIFCCLSYLLLVSTCIGVVVYYRHNSVSGFDKLRDSSHNPCTGVNKFLYFPTSSLQKSVCVNNCPDIAGKLLNCYPNDQFKHCPHSISGLIVDQALGVCYHPSLKLPLTSYGIVFSKSVFYSKEPILYALIIITAVAFFIAITVLIFPKLVYGYVIIFQFIMLALAATCFYRFFLGKLPFVDVHTPQLYFKGSYYLLGVGIFLFVSSIISITMLVTRFPALQFTIKIIRVAREVFCSNPLVILDAIILTNLSIGAFILNYWLFYKIQSFGYVDMTNKELSQYKSGIIVYLLRALFIIQALWTHGFIISLSHFIFEAKATLWYYTPVLGTDIIYSILTTIRLVFWHFGTICFGSAYTYYSQTFTNAINQSQRFSNPDDFQACCFFHNSCFKYLSIYGFIPTILEGFSFYTSNHKFTPIKAATEATYPQLYMQGIFFTNSAKFFLTVISALLVYFQLVTKQPSIYLNLPSLIFPLLVIVFLAHQIATIWMDLTGTVGDTVLFNRTIDTQMRGNPSAIEILNEKVELPVTPVL